MKKLFSIALAATMALSLAGCSGNSTASTTAAADTKAADTTAAAADTTAAAGGESTKQLRAVRNTYNHCSLCSRRWS